MLVLFACTVQVHPQIRITPTIVSLKFWYRAWGKNLSPKSRSHHLLKHTLSFLNPPRLGVCIDQCCIGDNIWFNVGKLHLRAGPEWPVRYSIHLLSESCIPWNASFCTSKLLYSLLVQVILRKWSPKIQKNPHFGSQNLSDLTWISRFLPQVPVHQFSKRKEKQITSSCLLTKYLSKSCLCTWDSFLEGHKAVECYSRHWKAQTLHLPD